MTWFQLYSARLSCIFSRNHASKEVFAETLADAEAFEESNFNQVDEDGLIDDDVNVSSFE